VGARLIATRDANKVIELLGRAVTIGRGSECEFQIPDDRISTRHCRLSGQDGAWMIEDLKSTNRTFVNGEPVGEQPRRLVHGDVVRLGAGDARLFEAQFVVSDARKPSSSAADEALHRKIAELQAALVERNAEIVRMGAMYRNLQSQLSAQAVAAVAAERAKARMTSENDEEIRALRDERDQVRADHAGCRDAASKLERRSAELEAQLEASGRKARRDRDDGAQRTKELESKLRAVSSELAVVKAALATESDNVRTLQRANEDLLSRLDGAGARN